LISYPVDETQKDRKAWCAAVHGGCKESDMTEQLNKGLYHFAFPPAVFESACFLPFPLVSSTG